jgi:hypothetical protein
VRVQLVVAVALLAGCRGHFDDRELDGGARDGDGGLTGDAALRPNRAFITSTRVPADLGGLAPYDAECAARATAGGWPGTFIALMGTSTTSLAGRIASSRGWVDTTGQAIVDAPEGWLDGGMWHPLDHDEAGNLVGYDNLWGGTLTGYYCDDWTATTGQSGVFTTRSVFAGYTVGGCVGTVPIACVEIGHSVAVSPVVTSGRKLFVTTTNWFPGGGLASADALCASEASTAGLTGTYLALLATSGGTAWSRFSTQGPTWTRLDGVALAATAAEVAADPPGELATFPIVTPTGHYPYAPLWTGTTTSHCVDWTTNQAQKQGRHGSGEYVMKDVWLGQYDTGCDQGFLITCVQQ